MSTEDDRTATHLSRIGVNPTTTARLREIAEQDSMSLRELVRYVLSDYVKHAPRDEEGAPS